MSNDMTGLEPKEIRDSVALSSLFRSCERIRRMNKLSDKEMAMNLYQMVNWYDATLAPLEIIIKDCTDNRIDCSLPVVDMRNL